MSRKNLWLVIATITIVTAGLIFGYSQKISNDVTNAQTIKIGYRAHDGYSPLFVGIEKGIFKKYGIDVQTFRFDSTNQIAEAMLANKIDASLGGVNIPLIMKTEEKSPDTIKIFSIFTETNDTPTTILITKHNSAIQSLKDLSGKKVAIYQGSTALMIYKNALKKEGVNPETTTIIPMNPDLELSALESGQVDAAMVTEPLATIGNYKKISQTLKPALWANYIFDNFPVGASILSEKFNREHSMTATKLIKATNETIAFINNSNNHSELAQIIAKYTPIETEIATELHTPKFFQLNQINRQKLQQAINFLLQEGEIKTSINIDNLLYQKL